MTALTGTPTAGGGGYCHTSNREDIGALIEQGTCLHAGDKFGQLAAGEALGGRRGLLDQLGRDAAQCNGVRPRRSAAQERRQPAQ